jgi:hypothetical protein
VSQGTEGTAFFSVENNFAATTQDFAALERSITSTLGNIRGQFSQFQGVEFSPLDKVYDKVNQQAGLIEKRLQSLFNKYQTFAKQGVTPEIPFSTAAKDVVGRSLTQVDKTVTGSAANLGDADLAQLRRTLLNGLAEGGTAAARELQSQLRAALRDAGQSVASAASIAGSANTLRPSVVASPILRDIPETQSAGDYVAATRAAARGRQDAAKASADATTADEDTARASRGAADAKGKAARAANDAAAADEDAARATRESSARKRAASTRVETAPLAPTPPPATTPEPRQAQPAPVDTSAVDAELAGATQALADARRRETTAANAAASADERAAAATNGARPTTVTAPATPVPAPAAPVPATPEPAARTTETPVIPAQTGLTETIRTENDLVEASRGAASALTGQTVAVQTKSDALAELITRLTELITLEREIPGVADAAAQALVRVAQASREQLAAAAAPVVQPVREAAPAAPPAAPAPTAAQPPAPPAPPAAPAAAPPGDEGPERALIAATERLTQARSRAADTSGDVAAADAELVRVTRDLVAKLLGATPQRPVEQSAPPAQPAPQPPTPPATQAAPAAPATPVAPTETTSPEQARTAGERAGDSIVETLGDVGDEFIQGLRQRVNSGRARFINGSSAVFDPEGPFAQDGHPIVSATTAQPVPPLQSDRLMAQVDAEMGKINAEVAELAAQIARGEMVALNNRVATQAPLSGPNAVPDTERTFVNQSTAAQLRDNDAIAAATRDLVQARQQEAEAARKAAAASQLAAEIEAGTAAIIDRAGKTAFRSTAPVGEQVVNARTAEPLPQVDQARIVRELQDQLPRILDVQRQVAEGSLTALSPRLAAQEPANPGDQPTIIDRQTGELTRSIQDTNEGYRLWDAAVRKAAADTQRDAARAQLEQRITAGELIPLGTRFATRAPTPATVAPVTAGEAPPRQEIFDRTTGEVAQDQADVEKALRTLADIYRKAAANDLSERIAEAERAYAQALIALAEDVVAKRRRGIDTPDTGVERLPNNTVIDRRQDATNPSVLQLGRDGAVQQLDPQTDLRASSALASQQLKIEAAETARQNEALREQIAATNAASRAQRQFERAQGRTGVANNFISGITAGGFGGNGETGLDGLARAAGQTAKYSTLYQALSLLRTGLSSVVTEFLDADDSIAEYEIAAGHAGAVTTSFQNTLQGISEVSGFNVGEALDVAAKAARAFGDELSTSADKGDEALNRLAIGFTTQASRLATLAKTTLTDSAGNLTAITSGFQLPKNNAGFAQVTDAIAGSKLAGGGDETQIFQGLANAAITFKNLGFSLNESATILSKINAQTDESGTLIATRLSRLTSVLNGGAASTFIQGLNQQLPKGQQIDQTASQRDQLIQLSKAYQGLSAARQGALISRLGGTAEERELSVLLQNLTQVVDEANKIKPGTGLEEFNKRLENVRAALTEIQGYIKTIIVNLASSGLAAPILELVDALKVALGYASDLSKGFKTLSDFLSRDIGGVNISITTLISNFGALLLAVRGLQTVRNNGGLRGLLGSAEEIVAPTRALARQQLAGTTPGTTPGATPATTAPSPLATTTISGRGAQAANKADLVLANPKNVAADAEVRQAADAVKAAGLRLAAAEDAQATLIEAQTAERRAFTPVRPGDTAALEERQLKERQAAGQAEINASLDLSTAEAQLARTLRVQAAQADVAATFANRRASVESDFQGKVGPVLGQRQAAEAAGDTAGVARALTREQDLRDAFNARLAVIEQERLVAEQRGVAIANAGGLTKAADAITLGGVSAGAAVRAEGGSIARAAGSALGTAAGGLVRGLGGLAKMFGPLGIGLAAVDFAFQVKGASDEIARAREDLKQVNNDIANKPITPTDLRDAASSEASAGANLREASGGLAGSLADGLFNGGRGVKDSVAADRNAEALKRAADSLTATEARLASSQSSKSAAASTLDPTDADKLKTGFDALQNAGFNASESMQLLITRLGQLRFAITTTAKMTADEQAKLAEQGGLAAVKGINDLTPTQSRTSFVGGYPGSGTEQTPIDPATELGPRADKIQQRVNELIAGQLQGGRDLSSQAGEQQLEDVLVRGYSDLIPDAAQARQLAQIIAKSVYDRAKKFAINVNSVADLQNVVAQGIQAADADAQRTQTRSQLNSLTTGTRDTSTLAGANKRVSDLQNLRGVAQQKLGQLRQAGKVANPQEEQQAANNLVALDDAIAAAQVQQQQAIVADAQAQLQVNDQIRQHKQRAAKTKAQIAAIGKASFKQDIAIALKTNDIGTIMSVFDNASQQEINAILGQLDELAKVKAAVAANAARVAAAANKALAFLGSADAQAAIGDRPLGDRAGGAIEQYDTANATAANSMLATARKAAAAAAATAKAAHAAASQSNPANNYVTGKDALSSDASKKDAGPTAAQIAAANAQAKAVRDRNSIEVARAAVQAARADVGAAKDQQSKAQALQQLYAAQNTLSDALKQVSVSRRFANINPNDAVANARKAVAEAKVELSKYARGTPEYFDALAQLNAAQITLNTDLRNLGVAKRYANINPNDSVANARKALAQARVDIQQYAKGSVEYYNALAQINAARFTLAADLRSLAVAKRFVNIFPASAVQSAAKQLAQARADIAQYKRGTLEYYNALATLIQAQRDLAEANQNAAFLKQKLSIDLTNPVATARLAVKQAQAKLALLQKEHAPADLVNQAKLDVKDAQNQSESAAFSQRLQDAQTNEELGRISHEAYLRYLNNEHNRLTAIRHRTRQQTDELNQIDQAIKAANDQFSGQFNIGDIKVPTIYEVRRAIAAQTGGATVTANSQAINNTTTTNNVTINGADFQKVMTYLQSIIGPQGASRITPIPRKG